MTILVAVMSLKAQEKEKSFFDAFYLGSLSSVQFKGLNEYEGVADIRIGAAKSFDLPLGQFNMMAVYGPGYSINQAEWSIEATNWLTINTGYTIRPITLHRPYPPTAGSHFEPPSLGKIPGGDLGLYSKISPFQGHDFYLGVYNQDGSPEYNLAYQVTDLQGWNLAISGYSDLDTIQGVAVSMASQWSSITVFNSNEWTSFLLAGKLNNGLEPYLTAHFDKDNTNTDQDGIEIGLVKNFSQKWESLPFKVNALFGVGYILLPEKQLNFYFQFYIDI
jgi:hypothetical protein